MREVVEFIQHMVSDLAERSGLAKKSDLMDDFVAHWTFASEETLVLSRTLCTRTNPKRGGEVKHYRAGTSVQRLGSKRGAFAYAAKKYVAKTGAGHFGRRSRGGFGALLAGRICRSVGGMFWS